MVLKHPSGTVLLNEMLSQFPVRESCARLVNRQKIVVFRFWRAALNTDSVVRTEETNHNAKLLATETENITSQGERGENTANIDITKKTAEKKQVRAMTP
jgi:hypothetical protein